MTNTHTLELPVEMPAIKSNRPHALDRVAMKVAIALLEWSNARISRSDRVRQEYPMRRQQRKALRDRETEALRLTLRIGL